MNNFLRPRKYERKYEKLKNREKKNTFMGNNFILLHLKHFDKKHDEVIKTQLR